MLQTVFFFFNLRIKVSVTNTDFFVWWHVSIFFHYRTYRLFGFSVTIKSNYREVGVLFNTIKPGLGAAVRFIRPVSSGLADDKDPSRYCDSVRVNYGFIVLLGV